MAVRDSSGVNVPGCFNVWKWILPKLTASERGGKKSDAKPEAVLKYAHTPITTLGSMWEALRQEMAKSDDPRPPVFIIVCKTRELAKIVYEWVAEDRPPGTVISRAQLPELRNDAGRQNTICVYSDVQNETETGNAKSDENRWMRQVPDTQKFEQSAAWHLDGHPRVFSFAKNEGMGFGIPYLHNDEFHDYLPDFLIRLEDEERYLILETKGYDESKEIKRSAAKRWVAAVNADGKHGRWQYVMVSKIEEINLLLDTI